MTVSLLEEAHLIKDEIKDGLTDKKVKYREVAVLSSL